MPDDLPVRGAAYKMARMAGPGESPYTQYDREIASAMSKKCFDRPCAGRPLRHGFPSPSSSASPASLRNTIG